MIDVWFLLFAASLSRQVMPMRSSKSRGDALGGFFCQPHLILKKIIRIPDFRLDHPIPFPRPQLAMLATEQTTEASSEPITSQAPDGMDPSPDVALSDILEASP